jgi:hypothetical protein
MDFPPGPIGGQAAWTGAAMAQRTDWIEALSPAELAEIDTEPFKMLSLQSTKWKQAPADERAEAAAAAGAVD